MQPSLGDYRIRLLVPYAVREGASYSSVELSVAQGLTGSYFCVLVCRVEGSLAINEGLNSLW